MTTTEVGQTPVVSVRNFSKTFGGVTVLDSVALDVYPGEVHGLLGENGSGKSTFIKVLAGFHAPDDGAELVFNGEPVQLPLAPGQFRALGISFVHQDLGMVPDLSVLENMSIGESLAGSALSAIPWGKRGAALTALLRSYSIQVDVHATVGSLEPTERALLAIVRAVEELKGHISEGNPALIILDEPTVFLPESGVRRMFALIREMVQQQASVIFVSHDLDEIMEHTDRLSVLRNGRLAGSLKTSEATQTEVIELIIGRALAQAHLREQHTVAVAADEVCLRVKGLTTPLLNDVDLEVHRGEIVGITGLMGSGYDSVLYAIYGQNAESRWEGFEFTGRRADAKSWKPKNAIDAGMGLIPADRKRDGIAPELSVHENAMLLMLNKYAKAGVLRMSEMRRRSRQLLEEYDVRPRRQDIAIGSLSGGNQQKVVLARWLQIAPKLLLLDEPTQGVDIGAREQLLNEIVACATEKDMAVICASTDYEQLERICSRVLIVEDGAIVGELRGEHVVKENIAQWVMNKDVRK
ncbi:sugar ABC transporter ATP-binding protein [Leucobacter sp. USHLN153]|uniref:sugar ABC transporter ATP-binding protein n=1 Tax=Leucobacter sp. USHLN153 TaxID=3081268 RepID=UPI003016DDA4